MKTLYECEHCGFQGVNQEEVAACEKRHLQATGASVVRVGAFNQFDKSPGYVVVKFADGTTVQYCCPSEE